MSRAAAPTPIHITWRMKMAQGDPYRPSEMTGDAEPTMTRPMTHRTPTSTARARADRSRATQPARPEAVAVAGRARARRWRSESGTDLVVGRGLGAALVG